MNGLTRKLVYFRGMKLFTRFNWRILLALFAVAIVIGSLFYSRYLSLKLDRIETQRVETWVEAQRTIASASEETNLNLAIKISSENKDIPIIETIGADSITGNFLNLDTAQVVHNPGYLDRKLESFKALHAPITLQLDQDGREVYRYYYGESRLQRELRYFPMIQLFIVALFITIVFGAQRSANRSTQNRLWVGMAKETAHQLGTPLTSLEGWVEILKQAEPEAFSDQQQQNILLEMDRDVSRLKLISDRFAKIGSHPKLEPADIVIQVTSMMEYVKRRAGVGVRFSLEATQSPCQALISPPLFDWVIENLLKNALDAMSGEGNISIHIKQVEHHIYIDVQDTGKGIAHGDLKKVFHPGFTTKKRGWGLGLALTKRIVEEYHHGNIYIKSSEPEKGTTFRIMLNSAT